MSDSVSRDHEFVTKEEFRRLEEKIDRLLSCMTPPPRPRSSGFDALCQDDNESTHNYDFPHEEDPERLLLPPRQPSAAGYTGLVRPETPVPPDDYSTSGSDDFQIPEEKLNYVSEKVRRLESRICYRLAPKFSGIQDCVKQITETVQLQTENAHISKEVDKKLKRLNQKIETLDTKFCKHLTQQMTEFRKEVKETINSLLQPSVQRTPENVQTAAKENSKILQDLEEIKRSNKNIDQEIKKGTEALKQEIQSSISRVEQASHSQTDSTMATEIVTKHIDESVKKAISEIMANTNDSLFKVKHDIFAITERECQLVRDRIEGPLPSHKTYTLDLYVDWFNDLIMSGMAVVSLPWHINQFKSSVQGQVTFLSNGKLDVSMLYGRHPREVGLQPQNCEGLNIKASIIDTTGELPDLLVGEGTMDADEDSIKDNANWGLKLGEIHCQNIVSGGYADTPGYGHDAVLVRYVVDVL